MKTRVVTRELPRARDLDDFRLHCAALEWSLAEPIIINAAADIKSRVDWKDRVEPFHHQVQNLMRFCRRLPVTLLADDVGLGKTISAGLIMAELIKRNRISKVLVICPKILIPQWIEELDSKFGITAYGATGAELRGSAKRTETVIVTTYHSASRILDPRQSAAFDMLVLDEAHKVRNLHGTPNPPKMATAIFDALEARTFKYVLMLTATPIQNRLWDIYSLVDCLAVARGHTNPFGQPEQFAERFIADGKTSARRLNQQRAEEFRGIVASYMFRTRRLDAQLAFPEREVKTYPVPGTPEEARIQEEIAACITDFSPLVQVGMLVALMSSPQALAAQLENMAAKGTVPESLAESVRSLANQVPRPAKARQVLRIAEQLKQQRNTWRMVIFTTRRETQQMLGEVFAAEGIQCGFIAGGNPHSNRRSIEAFRREPPDIHVVISTDAGAEGVNLQSANVLVNYDLPWNPMVVEQRIGRVQRIGSRFKTVWVANIVHHNSPEQQIVARLVEKLQVIAHTVGDIEAVLEAADDAEGTTLEQQIREMVIASLRGRDQAEAARLAADSIEQAKNLLEEQQHAMNTMLGDMHEADEADIPMPRIESASPSMSLEDFVLAALQREGGRYDRGRDGLYTGHDDNQRRVQFAFDPDVVEQHAEQGVFQGRAPQLYQPGKPAFERLVQRWSDRNAAHVEDRRGSPQQFTATARAWAESIPGATFVEASDTRGSRLAGTLHCITRVANAVDSYEKLLPIPVEAEVAQAVTPTAAEASVHPSSILAGLEGLVESHVSRDRDVRQFLDFYERRLERELTKSDSGERRDKLVNDLSPHVTADVAAIKFTVAGPRVAEVVYRFQSGMPYRSLIEIDGDRVTAEPRRNRCGFTSAEVPEECLETCQVTGRRGLRELMARSDISGGYAVPETVLICSLTGKQMLQTESETCVITGAVAARNALAKSELSGRYVVPDRTAVCEFTTARVADDELSQSGVSGKWFRRDQAVVLLDGSTAHASEATKCVFSGNIYRTSDCLPSAYSGKMLVRERAAESQSSGRVCDRSELRACSQTGLRLLPDELAKSDVSGVIADRRLMRRCCVSGRAGLKSELVKSAVSGKWMLPEHAVTLAGGQSAGQHEATLCQWTDEFFPNSKIGTCSLSGIQVDKRLLNAAGEFGPLRDVLDGELLGQPFFAPGILARQAPEIFRGIRSCDHVLSASGTAAILYGSTSFFGFNRRVFAVLARGDRASLKLTGKALFGKRTAGVWSPTDVHAVA